MWPGFDVGHQAIDAECHDPDCLIRAVCIDFSMAAGAVSSLI
jgi:hypothetical protein